MQMSMLQFCSTTKPPSIGNDSAIPVRGGERLRPDSAGVEARLRQGNNENDTAVINAACAATAPPAAAELGECHEKPRQSRRSCLSTLSEATGAVAGDMCPTTDGSASLHPPSATPGSGPGKYGLRDRHHLRSAQESVFEYSEGLLQELDVPDEEAAVECESEYERQRRERIAENLQKLHALGLENGLSEAVGKKVAKASKRKRAAPAQDGAPLRRSCRARTGIAGLNRGSTCFNAVGAGCSNPDHVHTAAASLLPTATPVEAPCFDLQPAPWAANTMSALERHCKSDQQVPWQAVFPCDIEVEGFHSLHCTLDSMQLKAIYSLDWHGSMVAAAGKEGWCSLFRVSDDPSETLAESLVTSRLHNSWLADVQLVPALTTSADVACDGLPWMVSACNDGALTLWDPSKVDRSGHFAELASTREAHAKGIFSMHICPSVHRGSGTAAVEALTSSKDSTVALTRVHATGMHVVQRWTDLHHGTVKCVRWRDSSIAATAGNDRTCKVIDVRSGGSVAHVDGGHTSAVNSVAWALAAASSFEAAKPCGQTHACEHQMLSTSFDAAMYVHDIRRPDVPLIGLTGHTLLPRAKSMHQAAFTWGGRGVACGGDGGELLSLYDIRACETKHDSRIAATVGQQGVLISQAKLNHRVTTTQVRGQCLAVAGPSSLVSILRCKLK